MDEWDAVNITTFKDVCSESLFKFLKGPFL